MAPRGSPGAHSALWEDTLPPGQHCTHPVWGAISHPWSWLGQAESLGSAQPFGGRVEVGAVPGPGPRWQEWAGHLLGWVLLGCVPGSLTISAPSRSLHHLVLVITSPSRSPPKVGLMNWPCAEQGTETQGSESYPGPNGPTWADLTRGDTPAQPSFGRGQLPCVSQGARTDGRRQTQYLQAG